MGALRHVPNMLIPGSLKFGKNVSKFYPGWEGRAMLAAAWDVGVCSRDVFAH